ncbi:MAG TPA: 1-acyl-sn-glycerol-3-phosphate acyltransferase [Thermoanaerobacterales bacterium]|nr:1-acyl-sn-glycerol-3-phosphate acyltransferase [Thermoanaerobacterales bacterium]
MLYVSVKTVFSIVFRILFKLEVIGRENVPEDGPLILCSNHISWLDPIIIACTVNRKLHYMAKSELFHNPFLRYIFNSLGAFPVKRKRADRKAIRKSLELLDKGEVLGLFPEGTRSKTGKLLKPEPGVALIALKSNSPILPVAIKGPYKLFHPITIIIGKPFYIDESVERKASKTLQCHSNKIMQNIGRLLGTN